MRYVYWSNNIWIQLVCPQFKCYLYAAGLQRYIELRLYNISTSFNALSFSSNINRDHLLQVKRLKRSLTLSLTSWLVFYNTR